MHLPHRIPVGWAATLAAVPAVALCAVPGSAAAAAAPQVPAAPAASVGAADAGVSSSPLRSWQPNNTVWALAYARGIVYAGGQFTRVRPPGAPPGHTAGQVPRTYLAAFSARTGALLKSFHPAIAGTQSPEVTALAVHGSTLYVGGSFRRVNGASRDDLAAFSLTTGRLTGWAPHAAGQVRAIAPAPNGSALYVGGDFGALDGAKRRFAGAVTSAGRLLRWAPALNNAVTSLAVAAAGSQVLVGGYFQTINGVAENAAGAVDPVTGTHDERWAANIVPFRPPGCTAAVKDIIIGGTTAYLAAEGTGPGCFDGDFAVRLSGRGDRLAWQNDCLGATQTLVIIRGWLFKGSHAHDCAYAPGGFPQVRNSAGTGWVAHHLLDQALADGTLGHFTPDTSSPPGGLGPRAMATDGSQLFLGGDFTAVNGHVQQALAIFPARVDPQYPARPRFAPAVTSTARGVVSVSFPAVWSRDVGTLRYTLYRDGSRIATLIATSWPWALPVLRYRDSRLRPGSSHTYAYTASDGPHTTRLSPASRLVTVARLNPPRSYPRTVLLDRPSFFWQLSQQAGPVAVDSSAHHFSGIYEPGTTKGVPGPIAGSAATATSFNGRSGLVTARRAVISPASFAIELWFRTRTDRGGLLAGFGNRQTGSSSRYDRHIYLMNDGQLVFGVSAGRPETIETAHVYNDGRWHYVVGTFGRSGMALYVDGRLAGARRTAAAPAYRGYWRVGGDNLTGWNLDFWHSNSQGTTQPNSYYFGGAIGDVAVYPHPLSGRQVAAHYAANVLGH